MLRNKHRKSHIECRCLNLYVSLTSRSKSPLRTSFAMLHGIGNVVVTFIALGQSRISVRSNSMPACIPVVKHMLNTLNPATTYHSGFPLRLLTFAPPVRVGRAAPPCVLIPTATLGIIVSKSRKRTEGASQNMARIPSTPRTSTLRGEWERMRVLHVCHC